MGASTTVRSPASWTTSKPASRTFDSRSTHRRAIRTTNLLERLFVEERRRLKIIPNAFGERAVLKLMFGAADPRRRAMALGQSRQLASVRKELDQEYETMVNLNARFSNDASPVKISSSSRT
jgi:transposase-like protein